MKNLVIPFVLFLIFLSGVPQLVIQRGMPGGAIEIPLATDGFLLPNGVGLPGRKADHATVAINDDLDIAVAFHTSRNDISGNGNLKQVEVAYFEYQPATDSWLHIQTRLIGSVNYHPIALLPQLIVKCERPDIIAVGNRFFVTWTRRYWEGTQQQPILGQEYQPAVLECAWIDRGAGNSMGVAPNATSNIGLGHILAAHIPFGQPSELFEVLECAGVPDAVVLNDSSLPTGQLKVGVAYPHQKVFSNPSAAPEDKLRQFTMRFVTCTFDPSTSVLTSSVPTDIQSTIAFNGPTALHSNPATAGLVLPDLAPSAQDNAFWIAAEGQIMDAGPPALQNGIIKLQYWQLDGGAWELQAGKTFKSPSGGVLYSRRRPMISSFPPSTTPTGVQSVSIAFNKATPDLLLADQSANVVYGEWQYLNGSGSTPPISMAEWPNSPSFGDGKPVPLRGGDSPPIRKCYADRSPAGSSLPSFIMSFDAIAETLTALETLIPPGAPLEPGTVGRPAVAYTHVSAATNPEYIVVAYEKKVVDTDPLRIWIGVE